jgi:hypothetical protein
MIYKKPGSPKKEEVVEMANQKDSTLQTIPTDKDGLFKISNLNRDDYKFYLAKRNKKIEKADIELIHDNRLKLTDDYLSLEMFDDLESENFIGREGNYSVVLREGFQHEISLSITGLSINGKLDNFSPDTSCQNVQLLLYDKKDSLIKVTTPMADCSFKFTDIPPGGYKMAFRNTNPKEKVSFTYNFTSQPIISRQFNSLAPKLIYFIAGKVSLIDSVAGVNLLVKLIDPVSKVVKDTVFSRNGKFHFDNLPSDKYLIVYGPDPKLKGDVYYTVDNNESSYHKEYSYHFGEALPDSTGKFKAEGKLITLQPDHSYVYLIDKNNVIKAKTHPDTDGRFSFSHLSSKDNKIIYELEDTNATAKLKYVITDESLTGEETVVLNATGTKYVGVPDKIKGTGTIKPAGYKIVRYNANSNFQQMESGRTYDSKGHIVKVDGFGVQIASYIVLDNMKRQYTKLINDGVTDAYVQVVTMKENGKTAKYYRIVIGAHVDLNELREREQKLKAEGFATTYRKHL